MKLSPTEKDIKNYLKALHATVEHSTSNVPRCYVHAEDIGNENIRLTAVSPVCILSIVTLKEYLFHYVKNYFEKELPRDETQFCFLPDLSCITKETPFFMPDECNCYNWKNAIPIAFHNCESTKPVFSALALSHANKVWKKATGGSLRAPDLWNDRRSIAIWNDEEDFIGLMPYNDEDSIVDHVRDIRDLVGDSFTTEPIYKNIYENDYGTNASDDADLEQEEQQPDEAAEGESEE